MECKVLNAPASTSTSNCINRNIVECKEKYVYRTEDGILRINRNIVECKDRAYVSKSPQSIVLIETLWNVKKGWLGQPFIDEAVLIETLWNVKSI